MDLISPSQKGLQCPQTPKTSPHDMSLPCDPRSPSTARKLKATLFRTLLRSSELKEDAEIHSSLKLRSRKSIASLFDALSPKPRLGKDIVERPRTTSPRKTKNDPIDLSPTRQMQRRKSLSSILGSVRLSLRKKQMAQDLHKDTVDDGEPMSSHTVVDPIPGDENHITSAGELLGVVAELKESQSPRSCSSCTWNSSALTLAPGAVSGNRLIHRSATPDSYLQHLINSHALAHSPLVGKSPSLDIADMIGLTTARMIENFHLGDMTHTGLNSSFENSPFEKDQGKVWDAIMIGGEILHKASLDITLKSFPSDENLARLFVMEEKDNTPSAKGETPEDVVLICLKTYSKLSVPPKGPDGLADLVEVEHCSLPPKCADNAAEAVRIDNFVPSRSAHFSASAGLVRVEYPSVPKRAAHVETYWSGEDALNAIHWYKYCELSEYGIYNPQNRTIYARLPESGQLNPKLLEKHGLEVLWLPVNAHLEDTSRKSSYFSSERRPATSQDDCRSVRHDEAFFESGNQRSRQTGASDTTLKLDETSKPSEADDKLMYWEDLGEICPALKPPELGQSRFAQLPRKVSEGQDCSNSTNRDVKDHCANDRIIAQHIDIETSRTEREHCTDRNGMLLPRLSTVVRREHTLEAPAPQNTFTWAAFLEGGVDGLIPYYGHYSTKSSSDFDTSMSSCVDDGLDTHISMVGAGLAQPENSPESESISYGASRKSDSPFTTILAEADECASSGSSADSLRNLIDLDMTELAMHQFLLEDEATPILSPLEASSSVNSSRHSRTDSKTITWSNPCS